MKLKKIVELKPKELMEIIIYLNFPPNMNLINLINLTTEMFNEQNMKYVSLFEKAASNMNFDVLIDVEDVIDQMVFDAYSSYEMFIQMRDSKEYDSYLEIGPLQKMFDFIPWYENILLTSKFELPQTRTIQKMLVNKLISVEVKKENYEKCSEYQSLIEVI